MSLSDYSRRAGRLIAESLAERLGLPAVPGNTYLAFAVQVRREVADGATWAAGVQHNNPLNLTDPWPAADWPGQTGWYSGGDASEWHTNFAAFGSLEAGCAAAAQNYSTGPAYSGVVAAFRGGDAIGLAEAISASPWSSDHYGYELADEVRQELQGEESEDDMTDEQMVEIVGAIKGAAASIAVYLWRQQHGIDVLSGNLLRSVKADRAAGERLNALLAEGKVGEVVSALDRTA